MPYSTRTIWRLIHALVWPLFPYAANHLCVCVKDSAQCFTCSLLHLLIHSSSIHTTRWELVGSPARGHEGNRK